MVQCYQRQLSMLLKSAILGMHNIVERAVVVGGQVVVRPIMYLALSYDHRIIDGRESVSILGKSKTTP